MRKVIKCFFLLVIILINGMDITAQNKTLDSLKLVLRTTRADTTLISTYISLGEALYQSDPENALVETKKAQELCERNLASSKNNHIEKIVVKKLYSLVLENIGALYAHLGNSEGSIEYTKKSIRLQEELKDMEGLAFSLTNLGDVYNRTGKIDAALECYVRSLKINKETLDTSGIALAYNNIAGVYLTKGDASNALNYLFKSLEMNTLVREKPGIARAFANIASLYDFQGDIPKALEYYSKGLRIYEEIGHLHGVAGSLNNMGTTYEKTGDLKRAMEQYFKALEIRQKLGDKLGYATTLHNIAGIYEDMHNYPKALEYSEMSLKIREEMGDKIDISNSYNSIAVIYQNQNKFELALEWYLKCLKIREEAGYKQGVAAALNNLAFLYLDLKNYSQSITYAEKAMVLSKELGYPSEIKNAAELLSKNYRLTNNFSMALKNYELYIIMRDSLINIAAQKASIKTQARYDYDKQKAVEDEKHLAEIKQQEEKAAAEKKRQNIIIASVSVVLLLVAVFSVILFNRFRVTQKQKAIIEIKEKETQLQKHLIEEKHKEITDSINYAERIQRSFLATQEHLNSNLTDYFVLFKPKDVVSGDFYWSSTLNNGNFALVTADSTGHGVPGAIMSLLNITSLEKAIETYTDPSEILNATRKIIIDRLKKDGSAEGGKDGMDCSLCVFDFKNNTLLVANANNPVWIVRGATMDSTVIEIKGDKMPVGKHDKQDVPFTIKEHELQKGDIVYTLTDGFPDQFGGEKGKKYMSKNLRELLAKNAHLPMSEQNLLLEKEFKNWVGDLEQVDDVTVIGIKV